MRELERKIVQLESMYAAAEKASTRVYIMPNVERLSLEKWHEMVEHPEGWMGVTFVKDGIPWYKFIPRDELPLYESLPGFHIEIEDLASALR
jgi:hypothetical protein